MRMLPRWAALLLTIFCLATPAAGGKLSNVALYFQDFIQAAVT